MPEFTLLILGCGIAIGYSLYLVGKKTDKERQKVQTQNQHRRFENDKNNTKLHKSIDRIWENRSMGR